MALETGVYISDLVATNPTGSDQKSQGDDHLRLLKSTIKATFPNVSGAVASTHAELNHVVGVTSAIQTQINTLTSLKATLASPTFTGTVVLPSTTSIGTVSATEIAYLDNVTSAVQTQIDSKSPHTSPTFTGTVVLPADTSIGTVSATEIAYVDGVTSAIQTQIDAKSPIASPTFTGIPSAPTASNGTNTTQLATTEFVNNTAMNAQLPSQAGNNGKFLRTDGSNSEWAGVLSGLYYAAKTGAYTALLTDDKTIFDCTGTWSLGFTTAATLGNGWSCYVRNSGTGVITLDPNASETVDGAATMTLAQDFCVMVQCDGTVLRTVQVSGVQLFERGIFSSDAATLSPFSTLEEISATVTSGTSVVYGNSLFVSNIGSSSTANAYTSPDGTTWTTRTLPSAQLWNLGTNGTDKFIASVTNSTTVASSTNGTTWAAATALPAAAKTTHNRPVFVGAICLILSNTASTAYTSSDNGVTWATVTLPSTTSSAISPVSIGGLFWYFNTGTTAYTSSTGATSSWASRTLPISGPSQVWKDFDGALLIRGGTGPSNNVYRSTDGINWTDTGISSHTSSSAPIYSINGVWFQPSATFGECVTRHNGKWATRTTTVSGNAANPAASAGTKFVYAGQLIDTANDVSAIFVR